MDNLDFIALGDSAHESWAIEQFHQLITVIPQQVWTALPNGLLNYVNQRVVDYFGLDAEQLLGDGWINIVHPDDVTTTTQRWQESLTMGTDHQVDCRLRRADGNYDWHIIRASPLRDEQGNIKLWVGTSTNISPYKEAQAALALSEAHLAEAQARALIGSWELNLVNGQGSATDEWFAIVGFDPAAGTPPFDTFLARIHPEDLARFQAHHQEAMNTPLGSHVDFRLYMPNGDCRWIDGRSFTQFDALGKPIKMIGTCQDITERKHQETALQESEASLAKAQAHAKLGSWRRDLRTGEAVWSAEMYRLFGMDKNRPLPHFSELINFVHPDDRDRFLDYHDRFIHEGDGYWLDFRLTQPDGNLIWIEARSETIRDAQGKAIALTGTSQDITDRKRAELALNASESRFRAFMDYSPALSFIKDEAGRFVYINNTFKRRFQVTPEQILNKTVFDLWPTEIAQQLQKHDADVFAANHPLEAIEDVPTPDGMRHWFTVKFVFINEDGQRFLGCKAIDLTDSYNAEQALRTSTELLNVSQAVAKMGGWQLDIRTQKLYWTEQIYQLLETTADEVTPTVESGLDYFEPDSRTTLQDALTHAMQSGEGFEVELDMHTLKGRALSVRVICSVIMENGQPVKLNGIFQDISEQKAARLALETANYELEYANRILEHIAHYDALTHLPNRVLLADRMQQAMIHNQRLGQTLAVAFLDLDGFKAINDHHGHSVGDKLLITLAHRMKAALREGDTMARIGGDEFVVVLTNLKNTADCEPLLTRLLLAASEPVEIDNRLLEVSASIGVTLFPQDNVDAEQLLRHADQAMYLAKQAGKNCYHLFDIAQDAAAKSQRESVEHIRTALNNQEFVLYYQPKVNMRTGAVIGAEALIRWQHPERGLLAPATFLPTIENHQLSIELGEWVIGKALQQMDFWQSNGLILPVSVNVGALQLQQGNFAERLEELLLLEPNINPSLLQLEILETSALEDVALVSATIHACRDLGVGFALDDFGTGYASLAYLKRLPAELLKIDQTFVRDMLDDPDDLAIIKGIVGLANAFRREVIAEGVETIAHGQMLLSLGCELAQGYGIARPMPASDIPHWVNTWRTEAAWSQQP